tara:strand:+ start:78 stop:488 length:411 start_codon:yes stop_codon:yes gene_type:complete
MLVKGDLDEYTTEKSKIKVNNFLSLTLITPAHVQFAKYGRGPGKPPPIDPIMKWLMQKGKITNPKDAKGAAVAIARSIGKNGTKGYKSNAPSAIEEAINDHLRSYVEKVNNKHVKNTIEKLDKSYKENLKKFTISI